MDRLVLYESLAVAPVFPAATVTPSAAISTQFPDAPRLGKWLIADFAGAASNPLPFTAGPQPVEYLPPRQRLTIRQDGVSILQTVQIAATPTTAGVQGFDWWFQKPFKSALQQTTSAPSATITIAATPITAGVQGFDWSFKKPFNPAQQQVTSFPPQAIVVATTPATFAGLQNFDTAYIRPMNSSLQQFAMFAPLGTPPAPPPVTELHYRPFILTCGMLGSLN